MRLLASLIAITLAALFLVTAIMSPPRVASRDHAVVIDGFILHTKITATMEACSAGMFQNERDDLATKIASWTYPGIISSLNGSRGDYRRELMAMSDASRDKAMKEGCNPAASNGMSYRIELLTMIDQMIKVTSPSI